MKIKRTYDHILPLAFAAILTSMPFQTMAATLYVDGSSPCSGTSCNGTSWNSAWKSLTNITGLQAGDTVYISGGTVSQSYSASSWTPAGGAIGNPITYKIGQDAGHNAKVVFDCGGSYLNGSANTIISGDAGDGKQHFALTNCPSGLGSNSNIRYSYIAVGTVEEMFHVSGSFSGIELDHLTARTTTTADHLVYWDNSATCGGYGQNKVHDNNFALSNNGPGIGADGFQGNNSCTDFYNNYIYGVSDGYSGGQHQDGHQPLWGNYIRIWNSKYENIANYPIFFDGYIGDFSHVRIYNNLITITSKAIQDGSPAGIAIGPDGGQLKKPIVFTDFVVANNTIVDMGTGHDSIGMYNPGSTSANWLNCYVYNNITLNGSGPSLDASVIQSNNVSVTTSSNSGLFVSYTPLATSNDFHLLSTATPFIHQGLDLSTYFKTDKDGFTRTAPWDVGAYAYHIASISLNAPTNLRVVQ
ncbi:MAG: hypothetical protein ACXVCP_16255 [Bdellovibrio sp.]